MTTFLERLAGRSQRVATVLCVGLDPEPSGLPPGFGAGLAGIERFARLVREAAAPHAAAVYFAVDESLAFYFFSEPGSLHSRHLQLNPQAAAAIYPECFHWQEIRGLQMHGRVITVPEGPDWQAAWRCDVDKFPYVADLGEIVGRSALYAFQPGWIRLVDNRRGFGFKQEWALP